MSFPALVCSQTTNISGVINTYEYVSSLDTTGCKARLELGSASGFSVGDSVLVIQMKGANFDSTNSAAFGSLINLSGAGNYEIAAITSITSNTIMLNGKLTKPYSLRGYMQVVKIPTYVNANVTGILTCQPWNGLTGGVLIFSVQNNLQFSSDIDVRGRGFRGGTISNNPDGNCGSNSPDYYYNLNPGGASWASGGAQKGEGIGVLSPSKEAGKGPLVTGGGGGNKQNAGGAGGSNYTAGGRGGFEFINCINNGNGLGGIPLAASYTNNVMFAGGGGGCGDANDGLGTTGENGGGIVIISTSTITGNNYVVNASGNTVTAVGGVNCDGAGGGGGGGSIFINAGSIASPLTLLANGGGGGDQNGFFCVGPGGGGGTGAIMTNLSSLSGLNYSLVPGPAGAFINGNCATINYGAMAGNTNTVGPLTSRILRHTPNAVTFTATAPSASICSGLPVTLTTSILGDNYSWVGPSFASALQYPLIAPTATTNTGDYTLTVTSLDGCVSVVTKSLTVNPTPTVSVPNFSVCVGQNLNIVPFVLSASSFSWNGPGGFTSAMQSPTLTNATLAMTGIYSITVSSVAGCTAAATGSIGVAMVSGVTVTVNSPLCLGDTLTLNTGGGSGNLGYEWTGPSSYSSTQQTSTIFPVGFSNAGHYTLVASVNGCSTTIVSPSVVVEGPPTLSASSVSVCSGNSVSLQASSNTGVTYTWTGPGGFAAPGGTLNFASSSPSMTGIYDVTVTSAIGCTNSVAVNLTVVPTPTMQLLSDQPVCAGTALNFTVSGAASHTVTGPNSFSSTAVNPSINNVPMAAAGIYTLEGSTLSCNSKTLGIVVIKSKPTPVISNIGPVCSPRDFQLSVSGGVTYTWTGPNSFSSTLANPTISPSSLASSGVYSVVVEGFNGCQSLTSTTVVVIVTPTVLATGTTVCYGQPATLNASGAVSYTWNGPNSYSATSGIVTVPVANNLSAGVYSLFVITLNTCTVTTTVTLSLYSLPLPTISIPSHACMNSTVSMSALGGVSYTWNGPGGYTSLLQSPSFIPLNNSSAGVYSVTALSAEGCVGTSTANLKIDPLPAAKLVGRVDACAPFCSDFQYKPLGLSSIASSTWISTTQYSTGLSVNYCFLTPGDVTVKAIIMDTLGCINTNTFVVHARVRPEADFEFTPAKPTERIDKVVFISSSPDDDKLETWSWFLSDNNSPAGSGRNFSHFFDNAGSYPVVLTVKNTWGCTDTIIKTVDILPDFNLFVPDAFTPNGDGRNELFQPKGTGIASYQLTIFDRWGQKVYESNVFEDGWDGTFKGQPCKSDVYVWEISASKSDGKKKSLVGKILLCR